MSIISTFALERAGSLAMAMLPRIAKSMANGGTEMAKFHEFFPDSPLVRSLRGSRLHFCAAALMFQDMTGVSQLFVDLIESAITSRYFKLGDSYTHQGKPVYGCSLEKFSCSAQSRNPDMLVRKFRNVGANDVEDARFAVKMAIHFRALCSAIERMMRASNTLKPSKSRDLFTLDKIDIADNLLLLVGDLKEKPTVGTDLDLRGRMTFRFFPAFDKVEQQRPLVGEDGSIVERAHTEETGFRPSSQLVLVLDPTDMFIVKPVNRSDVNRGTIICTASLRSVIAFASDGEWLHVAIRHMEDVGCLIKNGTYTNHSLLPGNC